MANLSTRIWPLEIHPPTSEPVLRLPAPHDNIIITPPRATDAPLHVALLNNPKIYPCIGGAYPHTLQDAQSLLERNITRSHDVLARMESNDEIFVGSSPVNSLREVRKDGTDQYLGNIHIGRHRWVDILDSERRDKLVAENFAKAEGDPGIVWDIGDHIAPSHQGKGIITAAIRTIIDNWAIPRMNTHKFREAIQKDNQASIRVFLKNGFIMKEVVEDCIDIHESKGGGKQAYVEYATEMPVTPEPIKPLEINAATNEPFLRLPPPHESIIITPPRMSDAPTQMVLMNDPLVYPYLGTPAYPHLLEHAEAWLNKTTSGSQNMLMEIEGGATFVGGCPVNSIRELREDGSEVFLGAIDIFRYRFAEVEEESRKKLVDENERRALGDPNIVWEIGYYLAPSWRGRGLMTALIQTMIEKWAIPRIGVRKIVATVLKGNDASMHVLKKNGFTLIQTLEDWVEIQASKGGGKAGLHVLKWEYE